MSLDQRVLDLEDQMVRAGLDIVPVRRSIENAIHWELESLRDDLGFFPDVDSDRVWQEILPGVLAHFQLEYDEVFPVTIEPRTWDKWKEAA